MCLQIKFVTKYHIFASKSLEDHNFIVNYALSTDKYLFVYSKSIFEFIYLITT